MEENKQLLTLRSRLDAWVAEQIERRRYEEQRMAELQREIAFAVERARQVELFGSGAAPDATFGRVTS
jgi:hypothetical protein